MSKQLRVGYVVEGATDYLVLDALVEEFLKDDYIPTRIQPPISEFADQQGPLGGGWRGVLRWCGEANKGLALSNFDVLIVHLDADVAQESELDSLQLKSNCPPATFACDKLRSHITNLLNTNGTPHIVLCTPAQCTEAWVFAALYYEDVPKYHDFECRREVERLLIPKPDKLVRDKDGQAKKQTANYRENLWAIVRKWANATSVCTEAKRFEEECRAALSAVKK